MWFLFFFSSRRRHTRWNCDWSSDVCSSDLVDGIKRVLRALDIALYCIGIGSFGFRFGDGLRNLMLFEIAVQVRQRALDRLKLGEMRARGIDPLDELGDLSFKL